VDVQHFIDTFSEKVQLDAIRMYTPEQREAIKKFVEDLYRRNLIEDSTSNWRAAIHLVRKKDNTWRFTNAFPIPNITDLIEQLKGAKFFSKLDLSDGFWHIKVAEKDRHKTAFTDGRNLYQWTHMPMGLTNSPATFQKAMQEVLKEKLYKCCMVYIDDIIVYSKTLEEHVQHVCFSGRDTTRWREGQGNI
jgi:hypothetical protein